MDSLQILFQAPVFSLQLLVDGLLIGAIFALAAYGMALVWGVMSIINVAQGEFVILGGLITVVLAGTGVNPLLCLPVAAAALFVLGFVLYRLVVFRTVDRDRFVSLLATFGISILLQQLMNQVFGADIRNADAKLGTTFALDGDIVIANIKIAACVLAVVVGVSVAVFLRRSRIGQAIRATAQNPRAARVLGVDTQRVYAVTFSINAALCGAAGALVAMTWVVQPYIGLIYTVRSFVIVVVAGVGNLYTVLLAGMGLGAAETFAGFILGAEFQAAFVFCILVVILLVRSRLLARQRKVLA